MTKMTSTTFSVGTLLRSAQDTGTSVRVLVQGAWLDGLVVDCDGLGAVLDDGEGAHYLVRLDSVAAVRFVPARVGGEDLADAQPSGRGGSGLFAGGPIAVPRQPSGEYYFLTAGPC